MPWFLLMGVLLCFPFSLNAASEEEFFLQSRTLIPEATPAPFVSGSEKEPVSQQKRKIRPATASSPESSASERKTAPAASSAGLRKTEINLFGTISFRSEGKDMPKWQAVLKREATNPGFTPERVFAGKKLWKQLKEEWSQLPPRQQAQAVNRFINTWPYKLDITVWGVEDYWEAPIDFFQKSGDCEDFAIAKYFALRNLGIPASAMRIVILQDSVRRIAHAVLVLFIDNDALVLDNLTNALLSHKRLSHYLPQFSVNEESRWVYVRPTGASFK